MTKLRVAPDLALPLQTATETFTVLGKRGTGKSYTTSVVVEELLKVGQQVVVVDPTDVWWGLRSSADGKSPGLPVVIFGGPHGDLPLTENDGEVIARAIIQQGFSCVLSLRHLSKGARLRFAAVLFEQLYLLKAERREPLMLVVDEADRFAPQKLMKGQNQERSLGALDEIVRMGRSSGFGVMLLTQRSAVISKDVISQTEVLICTRTVSPQDIAAVDAWISEHDVEDKRDAFVASLPSLPLGDAWWWSPGWLEIFRVTRVRPKETFDSFYTPKVGEKPRVPKRLADIDLDALKEQLAASIEKAKADDPRALRAELATVRKQLAEASKVRPSIHNPAEQIGDAKRAGIATGARVLAKSVAKLVTPIERHLDALPGTPIGKLTEWQLRASSLVAAIPALLQQDPTLLAPEPTTPKTIAAVAPRPRITSAPRSEVVAPAEGVTAPQQRILNALASLHDLGLESVQKNNVAVFADQSPRSSGFSNNLGSLRSAGLIDYPQGGMVALTEAGRAIAQGMQISTLAQLHEAWERKLPRPQWAILTPLIESYPDAIARDELAEEAEQSPTSSGYSNNLGALRSLGLIDYRPGKQVHATELLFPEGLT